MYNIYNTPAEQPISNRFVPIPFDDLSMAASIKQERYDRTVDGVNAAVSTVADRTMGSNADAAYKDNKMKEIYNTLDTDFGMETDWSDPMQAMKFNKYITAHVNDPVLKTATYNAAIAPTLKATYAKNARNNSGAPWRYYYQENLLNRYDQEGSASTGFLPNAFEEIEPFDSQKAILDFATRLPASEIKWKYNQYGERDGFMWTNAGGDKGVSLVRILRGFGIEPRIENGKATVDINSIDWPSAKAAYSTAIGADVDDESKYYYDLYKKGAWEDVLPDNLDEDYFKRVAYMNRIYSVANAFAYNEEYRERTIDPTSTKLILDLDQGTPTEVGGIQSRYPLPKASQEYEDIQDGLRGGGLFSRWGMQLAQKNGMEVAEGQNITQEQLIDQYIEKAGGNVNLARASYTKDIYEAAMKDATKTGTKYAGWGAALSAFLSSGGSLQLAGAAGITTAGVAAAGMKLFGIDANLANNATQYAGALFDIKNNVVSEENAAVVDYLRKRDPNWDKLTLIEKQKSLKDYYNNHFNNLFQASIKVVENEGIDSRKTRMMTAVGSTDGTNYYQAESDNDIRGIYLPNGVAIGAEDGEEYKPADLGITAGTSVSYAGPVSPRNPIGPGLHAYDINGKRYYVTGSANDEYEQLLDWTLSSSNYNLNRTSPKISVPDSKDNQYITWTIKELDPNTNQEFIRLFIRKPNQKDKDAYNVTVNIDTVLSAKVNEIINSNIFAK